MSVEGGEEGECSRPGERSHPVVFFWSGSVPTTYSKFPYKDSAAASLLFC
jgi:hypothetical protein